MRVTSLAVVNAFLNSVAADKPESFPTSYGPPTLTLLPGTTSSQSSTASPNLSTLSHPTEETLTLLTLLITTRVTVIPDASVLQSFPASENQR